MKHLLALLFPLSLSKPLEIKLPSALTANLLLVFLGFAFAAFSPAGVSAQTVTFAGTTPAVNFGNVNLCAPGKTTPAPCSKVETLTYNVTAGGTLGTPRVLTLGSPTLDFTLSATTCTGAVTTGSTCTVSVRFAPLSAGSRPGGVLITSESGAVLAKTLVYGVGNGPQIGFNPSAQTTPAAGGAYADNGIAVDGAGDIFVTGPSVSGTTPAGAPIPLPFTGIQNSIGIAVDGAGDIFVSYLDLSTANGNVVVVEAPVGSDSVITLPFTGLGYSYGGLAVDSVGDVFVNAGTGSGDSVVELLAGGATQVTLPFTAIDIPSAIALDAAGDVFVLSFYLETVVELPAGSSHQVTVLSATTSQFVAMTVDSEGDVFVAEQSGAIQELPVGATSLLTLGILSGSSAAAMTIDLNGNLFVVSRTPIEFERTQPPLLNFGSASVGSMLPLTITNIGPRTLTVTPSFNNASFTIASMEPADCLEGITASQPCALEVEFSPITPGPETGLLSLQTNGPTSPTVSLEGSAGVAPPVFSLPSGVYNSAQTVTITESAPAAKIYYTTNRHPPDRFLHSLQVGRSLSLQLRGLPPLPSSAVHLRLRRLRSTPSPPGLSMSSTTVSASPAQGGRYNSMGTPRSTDPVYNSPMVASLRTPAPSTQL